MKEITVKDLHGWFDKKLDFQLIDVREPSEFKQGHIGKAMNIPLKSIPQRIDEIMKDKPVVFICRSGSRSRAACEFSLRYGINCFNLIGGVVAWGL